MPALPVNRLLNSSYLKFSEALFPPLQSRIHDVYFTGLWRCSVRITDPFGGGTQASDRQIGERQNSKLLTTPPESTGFVSQGRGEERAAFDRWVRFHRLSADWLIWIIFLGLQVMAFVPCCVVSGPGWGWRAVGEDWCIVTWCGSLRKVAWAKECGLNQLLRRDWTFSPGLTAGPGQHWIHTEGERENVCDNACKVLAGYLVQNLLLFFLHPHWKDRIVHL